MSRTPPPSHVPLGALAVAVLVGLTACGPVPDDGSAAPADPQVTAPATPAVPTRTPTAVPTTVPELTPTTAAPTTVAPTTVAPTTAAPPTAAPTTAAPPTAPPTPSTPAPTAPASPPVLESGDSGPAVLALQERLSDLGYWLGRPDGEFGELTQQAVLALQGAAGLTRDGVVGPRTRSHLDAGTRPQARSDGDATEIDQDRGLLLFVRDGEVTTALHTSTGTWENYVHDGRTLLADTPRGQWQVTWSHDGWRDGALGELYRPRYFHRDGVAVHGYTSVPAYPASHGCARVTLPAMDMVWREELMPLGSTVLVY